MWCLNCHTHTHTHMQRHAHTLMPLFSSLLCPIAQPCPHGLYEGPHPSLQLPKLERAAGSEGFMVVPNPHAG